MSDRLSLPIMTYLDLPLLTHEQEAALARRVEAGDGVARDTLVKHNVRLAVHEAKKGYARLDFEDRVSVAVEALYKAAHYYRDKGYRFSTFATPIIRRELAAASADARLVRLPPKVAIALSRLERAEFDFYAQNGEKPTDAELAEVLGWPLAHVAKIRALPAVRASLDERAHAEQGEDADALGDILPDEDAVDPSAHAEHTEAQAAARAAVSSALAEMDAEAALALRLRHGLDGSGYQTCGEVAEAMQTTVARVYQALRRATRALRASQAAREAFNLAA